MGGDGEKNLKYKSLAKTLSHFVKRNNMLLKKVTTECILSSCILYLSFLYRDHMSPKCYRPLLTARTVCAWVGDGGFGWGFIFFLLYCTQAPITQCQHTEAWPARNYGHLRGVSLTFQLLLRSLF